jgi:hypothetical protein
MGMWIEGNSRRSSRLPPVSSSAGHRLPRLAGRHRPGRAARQQAVYALRHVQHVHGFLPAQRADRRPLVAQDLDDALGRQPLQRLAHRVAADAEARRQVDLHQALAGHELQPLQAVHDAVEDSVGGTFGGLVGGDGRSRRGGGHAGS